MYAIACFIYIPFPLKARNLNTNNGILKGERHAE
nr:MAG TPA: hypothetical protein [Bacteriophage sp.]